MKEIERKFLIKKIPATLKLSKPINIKQYYINDKPEIRIRQYNNRYILTFKSNGNLIRNEIEIPINQKHFNQLKQLSKTKIEKIRYCVLYKNYILEIGKYKNFNLLIVKIEFNSLQDVKNFISPKWFNKEVVENIKYKK